MINEYNTEKITKLDPEYLELILKQESSLKYFGDWINDYMKFKDRFLNSAPFEHIIIDNFLEDSYAEKLYKSFPDVSSNWYEYKNPPAE